LNTVTRVKLATVCGLLTFAGILVTPAVHGSSAELLQGAAGGAKTVWDGVYSQEQSARGESVSTTACVACHGEKLAGSDIGPALQGNDFLSTWGDKTANDLFEKMRETMPADSPGTLKPQQYADVLAYILTLNSFPAGPAELGPDPSVLKALRITAVKP